MKKGAYLAAVTAVMGEDVEGAAMVLVNLAYECDQLHEQIVVDARRVAARFTEYAVSVESSLLHDRSTPNGYTTAQDIERHAARLESARRLFWELAKALGTDKAMAVRAHIAATVRAGAEGA